MDAGLKSQAGPNGEVPMQMMRVDRQVQSGARAGSRMGARARVGLPPGGREAGLACGQGACIRKGGAFLWRREFLEEVAVHHF